MDVIFLSPPWGGPQYLESDVFDIQSMIPLDGIKIFEAALEITENIAYYVPKNANLDQLISLFREYRINRILVSFQVANNSCL